MRSPLAFSNGQLRFEPAPLLAKWLFTTKAESEFGKDTFGLKLFGKTWLVYHNPSKRDTYSGKGVRPKSYTLRYDDGQEIVHAGSYLPETLARDLRDGKLQRLTVELAAS